MKKKTSVLEKLFLFAAALMLCLLTTIIFCQQKEIKDLKAADPYSGYVFSTIQVYNDETGKWDTYQGTLDFDCGLHGTWMYEINGVEAVMTGARLIGSVEPGEEITEYPTAEEGNVLIYADTGEKYLFHGIVATPTSKEDYIFYMPTAELIEFDNLFLEGENDNEE